MHFLRGKLISLFALCLGFVLGLCILEAWGPRLLERAGEDGLPLERAVPPALPPMASPRTASPSGWDASLGAPPVFVDITASAGIAFTHVNGHTGKFLYPEIMGAGVGLFDTDGDGLLDVYLVNGNHLREEPDPAITNKLYRNNGDGTFTDTTARAGVGDPGYGQGCCVGDYDNDGDLDLYVSNLGHNRLYRNEGDGTFTEVAAAAGVDDPDWGQSCVFLDHNGDGQLDLYVQNYLTFCADTDVVAFIYVGTRRIPDYPAPSNFEGAADRLYRNNGDGTFTDVTVDSGLMRSGGKGMGCACYDMNGSGHVDIFVTNDGMENYLFRNRGDGTFEEIGLTAGVAFGGMGIPEASMGVDVGDYDGDGLLDMIVPCTRQQTYTLYRNHGDFFVDVSQLAGLVQVTSDRTGFSPNFLDYDNDGDLDLFFTTGGVRANELVPEDADYDTRYGARDILAANDGRGAFVDVSAHAGPHFQRQLIGRGAAAGDLDNDGDIDLVILNLAGPAVVLRNDTSQGRWLTIILAPNTGSADALGTVVRATAGGRTWTTQVHSGVSYLSQNDRRVHFGLGSAARVDRLEIVWPGGELQVLEDLPVNRFITVVQPGAAE